MSNCVAKLVSQYFNLQWSVHLHLRVKAHKYTLILGDWRYPGGFNLQVNYVNTVCELCSVTPYRWLRCSHCDRWRALSDATESVWYSLPPLVTSSPYCQNWSRNWGQYFSHARILPLKDISNFIASNLCSPLFFCHVILKFLGTIRFVNGTRLQ